MPILANPPRTSVQKNDHNKAKKRLIGEELGFDPCKLRSYIHVLFKGYSSSAIAPQHYRKQ